MQIHQLKTGNRRKGKKRIARGGKRGTYSGRGQKGQKSRSGHRIRPAQRDLIQRLPKFRGHNFKSISEKTLIINAGDLEKKIKGNIISRQTLIAAGVLKKNDKRFVKILGDGSIKSQLEIQGLPVSESAKKKILAAGGKILEPTNTNELKNK